VSDEILYWIGFNFVRGVGAVRFQALRDFFGSAEAAWHAPADALRATGLGQKIVDNILQARSQINLEKTWDKLLQQEIQVITLLDDGYPRRLRELSQPPPVLYLRGTLLPEDDWAVAIVGTRRMTMYGRAVTEDIVQTLAAQGITIISGLARGIDGAAHTAAVNRGGRTLAVLGCGVDQIYPPDHRQLAERIITQGGILSDYAPGTPPDAINFPPRNRLISGLAQAVVVVEAGSTSGALITAQFAADQGREVFAVPGNINAAQSVGPNRLIRDGAQPLLQPQDILDTLNMTQVPEHQSARAAIPADPLEARVLQVLGPEPVHVDEITFLSGIPVGEVTALLTMLELKGMVRQVGGMSYVAVRELPAGYLV
jgi:DNA processing protein